MQSVAFDCKTATVTMKKDAKLTKESAESALKKEGFGVTSFKAGATEKATVHLLGIGGMKEGAREDVRRALAAGVPGASEVVVDSTGSALLTMRDGASADEKAIAELLRKSGLRVERFETKEWPVSSAGYDIAVSGMTDAAAGEKVRDILDGLDKVISTQIFRDVNLVTIRLNEPCDRIEAAVRESLGRAGFGVTSFELVKLAVKAAG